MTMTKVLLYVALPVFSLLICFFIYEAFHLRKRAKERRDELRWNLAQIRRALELINSENRDDLFTALHILSALNHPSRLQALPRLVNLAANDDPHISELARGVIIKMGYATPPSQVTAHTLLNAN